MYSNKAIVKKSGGIGSEKTINKHSAIIAIQNKFTLEQRKCLDVLIFNARQELDKGKTEYKFTIKLSELRNDANILNSDYKRFKNALVQLATIQVQGNIFQKDKSAGARWDCFSFLAGATIENNILTYSFPHQINDELQHPSIYSKINLNQNKLFESKHGLALNQFIKDYIKVQIPVISIEDLRILLDVKGRYKVMKDLRRRVLDPAVHEISTKTDINLEYFLLKTGRKITHIRFIATDSKSVLKVLPTRPGKRKAVKTQKEDQKKAKSSADFASFVDRAEEYFQNLPEDAQSKTLKEMNGLMIFVPPSYKKQRNFGARLKGYFELKKIDFME